ncbi:MAG: type II CAAX prenyl endopeptidase Rce1 family protein [Fidelibacterota bacterium]
MPLSRLPDSHSYWSLSRSPYYSFVFTLPLFGVYEVMVLFLSRDQLMVLRNGADVLLRQILGLFGLWGIYVLSIAFIVGFIVVFLWQKNRWHITSVRGEYLLKMAGESVLWGMAIYVLLRTLPAVLMFPSGEVVVQQVVLAIGAGLYEEFVFRVLAINIMSVLLKALFLWRRGWRKLGAILFAAGLFSAFHFVGQFGDSFNLTLFGYRFLAGTLLGALYVARGFGITAYAHTVYDFVVVFNLTTAPS